MKKKSEKYVVNVGSDFFGCVLNCAVRYALGRMSYMPGLVMDEIRPMLPHLSEKTLWCFDKDIEEALPAMREKPLSYYPEWRSFQLDVKREREKRKNHDKDTKGD